MDLIYRWEAIEALGEEPMVWLDLPSEIAEREQWRSDVKAIEAVPSAQPEIIRCKDCKYYEGVHNIQGHAPCTYWESGGVLWNWFCSQAERWEDERNDI